MKSHWISLMQGGAAKVSTFPCHCCFIMSSQLIEFKTNELRCDKCKEKNRNRCYHWQMCDSDYVEVNNFNTLT